MATVAKVQHKFAKVASEYASLAAAVSDIGAIEATLILEAGITRTLTANLTIPANVALDPRMGVIATGMFTLTIEGECPEVNFQVFDVSGGGSVVGLSRSNPRMFGAQGDGSNDDGPAFVAAFNAGTAGAAMTVNVSRPASYYSIQSALGTIPEGVIVEGPGKRWDCIKKEFNGDLLTLSSYAQLRDLRIVGNGATYTGRGVVMSSGSSQVIEHCAIIDFSEYCVEFSAANAGASSKILFCDIFRTTLTDAAIKMPTDSAGSLRRIFGCDGAGGVLCDFGGASDVMFIGNFTNDLFFGDDSAQVFVQGCRIALVGGTMTVRGQGNHQIVGNAIAGNIDVASGSGHIIGPNEYTDFTDSSGGTGHLFVFRPESYTTTWSSASDPQPAIGNGTLKAMFSRSGMQVTVTIELTIGSTTTFGTGQWGFSLPFPAFSAVFGTALQYGAAAAIDQTGPTTHWVELQLAGSASVVNVGVDGVGVSATVPFTWADTDVMRFTFTYNCN